MFIFILSLFAVGIRKTISTPSTRRNGKKNKRFTTDQAQYQYNNAKKLGLGLLHWQTHVHAGTTHKSSIKPQAQRRHSNKRVETNTLCWTNG